jgi:hypothetical protein
VHLRGLLSALPDLLTSSPTHRCPGRSNWLRLLANSSLVMVTVSNSDGAVTPSAAPLPASPFSKKYNPHARSSSQVIGPNFRLTVLTSNLIRYEYSPDSTFEDRASTFAVHRHLPAVPFQRIDRPDGGVEIHTEVLSVEYDGKAFSPSGFTAMLKASADRNTGHVGSAWGKFWRYGMENDAGNLGGTCRTLDNVNGRCELEEGVLSTVSKGTLSRRLCSPLSNLHWFSLIFRDAC